MYRTNLWNNFSCKGKCTTEIWR